MPGPVDKNIVIGRHSQARCAGVGRVAGEGIEHGAFVDCRSRIGALEVVQVRAWCFPGRFIEECARERILCQCGDIVVLECDDLLGGDTGMRYVLVTVCDIGVMPVGLGSVQPHRSLWLTARG